MHLDRWITSLLDHGLEEVWDGDLVAGNPLDFPGYGSALGAARERTGLDEAVVTGSGSSGGRPLAVVLSAFDFFGGSMGAAVGERVARAFDRAGESGLPVLSVLSSGGARMQEGLVSLAQMPKTLAAAEAHGARGLFQVTVCTNPTAGGMWASFGSRADVVLAEVDATIGFAGPRVAEHVTGEPLPGDAHTPQAAFVSGVVDAVVEWDEVPSRVRTMLTALGAEPVEVPRELTAARTPPVEGSGWHLLERIRLGELPGARRIVERVVTDFTPLSGDRAGGTDRSVIAGMGRWRGRPVVVVGQDRHTAGGRTRAAGFRLARRACDLAGRLGLPVVTLIDTPGADPAHAQDRAGLVPAISALTSALLNCPTPVVSVCVGEGGSGGAMALAAGDVLLMQQGSVFSVIAPAAAAQILRHDGNRTHELADTLRIRERDAVDFGIADAIVPVETAAFADTVAAWIDGLRDGENGLVEGRGTRFQRWRRAGQAFLESD